MKLFKYNVLQNFTQVIFDSFYQLNSVINFYKSLICIENIFYCVCQCVSPRYFKTDSELIYQDRVDGNILEQVDKTMDLIFTKYLKAYISYDGIQRVESFPISQLAFREALTNAIVHKDYGELTAPRNHIKSIKSKFCTLSVDNHSRLQLESRRGGHQIPLNLANSFEA